MLRSLISTSLMTLLTACNFQALDHDPKTVFNDADAYRVSREIIEIIRAKDVEKFIARAHPDAAKMDNI